MVATVFGADADVALAASVSEADDFGSPLVLAIIVAACLSVLGVAFAVGIFVCIAACVFILFGILTTSAAVAFFRRNPMSGLRALFIQIGAVAGAICGAGGAWLVPRLANFDWPATPGLVVGTASGFVCGALAGVVVNLAVSRATAQLVNRYRLGRTT